MRIILDTLLIRCTNGSYLCEEPGGPGTKHCEGKEPPPGPIPGYP